MNTFGTKLKITIFGESHSKQIGIVIDGCPPGIALQTRDFAEDLNRRKATTPGTTSRKESDKTSILSGVFNGFTTGATITITIANEDINSGHYEQLQFRPGHADFTAHHKYKGYNDYRGGGMFSGRTTVALVAAGVVAKKILKHRNLNEINFNAKVRSIGGIQNDSPSGINTAIMDLITETAKQNDSIGGVIECNISNVPVGLGEPYFDSIESVLAHIIFAIPGIKGIEFGDGFEMATQPGSATNDAYINQAGATITNHSGGINGGISNGNNIVFRVAARATASIAKAQVSYNFKQNITEELKINGRHDTCFALRLPVVIEAVAAIVIADFCLIYER